MTDLVGDMYRQNAWANRMLFDVCRGLTDVQLAATAPGVYGSIANTLQHIVAAETGYAIRLGATTVERLKSDDPWPGRCRALSLTFKQVGCNDLDVFCPTDSSRSVCATSRHAEHRQAPATAVVAGSPDPDHGS